MPKLGSGFIEANRSSNSNNIPKDKESDDEDVAFDDSYEEQAPRMTEEEEEIEEEDLEENKDTPPVRFALRYNLRNVEEGSVVALNGSKIEPRVNNALQEVFDVERENVRLYRCIRMFSLCLLRFCPVKDIRRLIMLIYVRAYCYEDEAEFCLSSPLFVLPGSVNCRLGRPQRIECVAVAGVNGTILGIVQRKLRYEDVKEGIQELYYTESQKAEVMDLACRRAWKRVYVYEVIPISRFNSLFTNRGGNFCVIKKG